MTAPSRIVLLGHPVEHSVSPIFQNAALLSLHLPIVYEAVDVEPARLDAELDELVVARAAGNVTIPHKERVAARCARVTPIAARVGAVNTFWTDSEGALAGDNTDVAGFDHLARRTLEGAPLPERVSVLGAGGAAAAVLAALERWPKCSVRLYNRSRARLERLAARFDVVTETAVDAEEAVKQCGMVINATPIGLRDDALPVSVEALERDAVVVDLVYRRHGETAWVRAARAGGHRAADGLEMLLEQGALAFERWFGVAAPRDVMREAVRRGGDAAEARESGCRHSRESGNPSSGVDGFPLSRE